MQQPEKSVSLAEAQQSRRIALRALAAATGSALFFGATQTRLLPSAATLAMEDDDDNSGHGSRNSGHGHGGDNGSEDRAVPQAQIPAGSIAIRIVSDDADGFSPSELTVDLGQSVTFVNTHRDEHTATGSGFDTGIIPAGGIATVVMNEPGIFAYACQIHPVMTGRIAVRDDNGVVPESQSAPAAASPAGGTQVRIANLVFTPATLHVSAGATVTWQNDDVLPHTVTAVEGSFDSGILYPGASFNWTFANEGSFAYHCLLHPNMQGTVVFGAASGATTASAPAAETAPATSTAAPAAAQTGKSSALEASIWIADFTPNDTGLFAPQRALLSLHTDGLVNADFAAIGIAAAVDGRLAAGQGRWRLQGDRLDLALVAFLVHNVGQLRGALTMRATAQLEPEKDSVAGTWTWSLANPRGETVSSGDGTWQGAPVQLDLETTAD